MPDETRFIDSEQTLIHHVLEDGTVVTIPASVENADYRELTAGPKPVEIKPYLAKPSKRKAKDL